MISPDKFRNNELTISDNSFQSRGLENISISDTAISEFEDQVTATIEGGRKTMLLLVRRNSDPRFLALTIQK